MANIDVQRNDGWLSISLARPEKYNALTVQMYGELADLVNTAAADDSINVVLITGGRQFFTSGNDLKDFMERPPTDLDAPAFRFMAAVVNLDKPLIACVCGPAVGIGTTLLPHCDFVVASVNSQFSTPFVKLGLCQEFGASLLFPQRLGHGRAARLLLAGERIEARTALDWGLCTHLLETPEECHATAVDMARALARAPKTALRVSKRLLKKPPREALLAIIREENLAFIECLQSEDSQAALRALVNKR
ncbi:enoyl-CoA hydratase [Pseudomonas silvicola]|nr:enoyl-CoA hydratase [Pseudomonas silvicola]